MRSQISNTTYRVLSKFYDLFDLIFLLGGKGNPRTGLLKIIPDCRQNVLDLCVGTAASALIVAGSHPNVKIVGVDISADMLAVARRKVAQRKLHNLDLRQMSATNLSFPDNSFDQVMVSFALHEFDRDMRDQVFREVGRVLKPAGQFCVIDFSRQENTVTQIFLKIWTFLEPPCFRGFLAIDWHSQLAQYGLCFESEQEFSFSKLYIFRKL